MRFGSNIFLAIGILLLALEHFGVPIPAWMTGAILLIAAILMLF